MTYAPAHRRWWAFFFGVVVTASLLWWTDRSLNVAVAQEQQPADKAEKKEEPKSESRPAAKKKGAEAKNLFWHIVESAGPFFGPLLLLISIGLIWLIVMLSMDLRLSTAIPPGFVEDFTDIVNKRQFKAAYDLARGLVLPRSRFVRGHVPFAIRPRRGTTRQASMPPKASKQAKKP